jgi:hypothetical protein
MEKTMRIVGARELDWKGDWLYFGQRKLVRIVPDEKYPTVMWRVERPDGTLTDMVNRARAKDAAITIGLKLLNSSAEAA